MVAVMSVSEDKKTVSARYKFYEFVDGDAYDTDTNFKKNIFEYIEQSKADEPSYPEVTYKKAKDKADAFEKLLKDAKGDEIKTILLNHQATNKLDITSTSTVSSTLPKVVRDKATASTVKAGDILNVKDGNVYYVIYVSDITSGKTDISFVSFESDLYFKIIEDLTETLDKVYPTEKTANYKAPKEGDTTVDTFEEWISELSDKTKFTSARAEHDAKYFKVEKTENKVTTTTYNAYIIVNTPMYLEEEMVVKGGYLLLKDTTKDGAVTESKADKVAKALETLKNKTDIDLLNALYAFDSSATVSESIAADSITDENLKAWLFAKERTQNEIASFDNKAGDGTYVARYSDGKWFFGTAKALNDREQK